MVDYDAVIRICELLACVEVSLTEGDAEDVAGMKAADAVGQILGRRVNFNPLAGELEVPGLGQLHSGLRPRQVVNRLRGWGLYPCD